MSKKDKNLATTKEFVENAWLNLGKDLPHHVLIPSAFGERSKFAEDKPLNELLELLSDPNNFYFTIKHVFNIELLPFQLAILKQLWTRKYPLFVGSRGAGKSFMLGLYAMLRAFLNQGCKIIIVGAAFRQAKVVFEYCEKIWNEAPVLRSICGTSGRSGPRRDIDRCTCTVGDSLIIALPLGDGTKIRGQRANYIIADEFACLDKNSLVETNNGLIRISDCKDKELKCLNMNGDFESPSNFVITPKTDVYEITTVGGYSFKCSDKHSVMTMNGWKLAKDLQQNDYLVFDNKYKFPTKDSIDKNIAWLFGVLVSEGSINHESQIQVRNTDKTLIDRVINSFSHITNNNYSLNHSESYIDKRGWACKESWNYSIHSKETRKLFLDYGLDYGVAIDKKIPSAVLTSSREAVLSFLSGLFEGDGSCFLWKDREILNKIGIAYYSVSKQLIEEVQIVLKKLGYFSTIQTRKSEISDNIQYIVRLNGRQAYEFAKELNIEKWNNDLEKCFEKDIIDDDCRVVWDKSRNKWKVDISICGSNKYIGRFVTYNEAVEAYIKNKPINHIRVCSINKLDYQDNLYDFYLPETNSFYANGFIQHNSIPEEIYENVVSGFAAVSANPVKEVKKAARIQALKDLNLWNKEQQDYEDKGSMGNQAILSGTAYYDFNHFSKYWKRYKEFILSKGNPHKLKEFYPEGVPASFNYKDYVVIRMPVELLPKGFMDDKHVARSKATVHSGIYKMEFGACFSTDSNGFFKRSLIESCVTTNPINDVQFHAELRGNPRKKYIFGIDPASENDNFSIVILEVNDTHRRIVYSWTTTRTTHKERVKSGTVGEQDFYGFCARKIRDLMKVFPCERLVMDAQGGGVAVEEALHDSDKLNDGEVPIWQIIEDDIEKDSDNYQGMHILQMVQFAKADWVRDANHGLRKDFEDKAVLFPFFDPLSIGFAIEDDKRTSRLYDTLEDCVLEIEELKDELATIVHTQTGTSGRDKWDTPEVKMPGGKKGRLRKDRYSALLIANMVARTLQRTPEAPEYNPVGGFANQISKTNSATQMYVGNQGWNIGADVYRTVKRGV